MNPNPGGFSFGQQATSSMPFGQQPGNQQSVASPFTQPAQSTNTAIVNPLSSGGFSFSSANTSQASFANPSAPVAATSPFNFATTPATSGPATAAAFNFGGGPPAYSQPAAGAMSTGSGGSQQLAGFGGSATSAGGFGIAQPTASPIATGGLPSMGSFNFGAAKAAAVVTPFGQTPQTAVVAAQPAAAGFNFNRPATGAATPAQAAFGFGQTQASGGFGGVASAAASTGAFTLGGATTASGAFGVGASTAPPAFSLPVSAASPAATGMTLGGVGGTAGGMNFGANTFSSSSPSGFGLGGATATAPTVAAGAFSLGAHAATPAYSMGAAAPSTATTTASFALPAASYAQSGGFAMPAAAGGMGFNTAATATPPPFSLGATMGGFAASTAAVVPTMGGFPASTAAAATSGLGYNLGGTATQATPFGIASPSLSSLGGGFSLGSAAPAVSTSINFSSASSAAATSGGFGAPLQAVVAPLATAPSASGYTLGQPPAISSVGFGLPAAASGAATAVPSTGLSLGLLSAAPSTSAPGFTLGQAAAVAAPPATGGINFSSGTSSSLVVGATVPSLASVGTSVAPITLATTGGFGGFGTPLTAAKTAGFTMGATGTSAAPGTGFFSPQLSTGLTAGQTAVSTLASVGLGGATTTVTGLGGAQVPATDSDQAKKTDGKSIRETPLPPDIFNTIATFEIYKDAEKKASEENARQSATPFHKLGEDAKKLKQHIVKLSNQHAHLHSSAAKLKSFVVQDALNVEMARRTQDTPMNLQGENKSPEEFFLKMVRSFEVRMASCRNKINEVEKGCTFKDGMSETTPEDIMIVLKREHRAVKMMAAQVYTIHNKLIDVYQKSDSSTQPKPELLFRTTSPEKVDLMSIISKDSSVLRPCLGDITSGLMEFQYGQQRAKALSLGAAPPTQALGPTGSSFLSPHVGQSNIFNTSAIQSPLNLTLGQTASNNNSFNFGKRPFGSANTSFSSPFSLPNQTSGSLFSPNANSTSFGVYGK